MEMTDETALQRSWGTSKKLENYKTLKLEVKMKTVTDVKVTNPVQISGDVNTVDRHNIRVFTYSINPNGNQAHLRFNFIVPTDSIIENISYTAVKSLPLILRLGWAGWSSFPVLSTDGCSVDTGFTVGYSYVMSPITPITIAPSGSRMAFTANTNIAISGTSNLDIYLESLDGTNIPSSAGGYLTLQLRSRVDY
jgi:hypothetical protein